MKKRVMKKASKRGLEDLLGDLLKDMRLNLGSRAASLVRGNARSVKPGAPPGAKPGPLRPPAPQQTGTTRDITFSFLTAAGKSDYEWLNIRRLKVVLVNVNDAARDARKGQRAADETDAPQYAQLDRGPRFEWQHVMVNVFQKVPIA
jgi:hypothetical protein